MSLHTKKLTGAHCSDMEKIREGKAVISLIRSISLSKQIFSVKLKREERLCVTVWGFPPQMTAMARKHLENWNVFNVFTNNHKERDCKKQKQKPSKPNLTSQSIVTD